MNAIILSVGDELILGQTVDTNSAWLSQQLAAVGCPIRAHMTVADDQKEIERAISDAAARCDFLLISGGIGPTEDDMTRQALAGVMGVALELHEPWLAELDKFFKQRGRAMPPINRIQAMIPAGARALHNTAGTAAGIAADLITTPAGRTHSCTVFVMPGVPKEMKIMFARDVLPVVAVTGGGAVILSRTLHTFGLGESAVAELLGDLMRRDRNPSVGTTVSNGIVSLRVNARAASKTEAATQLEQTVEACRAALGALIFGQDEQTLQEIVALLLTKRSLNLPTQRSDVATAESCTGGLVAKMLTDVAGSSRYFRRGWITYSNDAKEQMLGVPGDILREHGAVSEPVVLAMANAARNRADASFALAISGIAGPTGGTEEKPVGTVWIALAHPDGASAKRFIFPGDREMIRDRSAKTALTMLRYKLLGLEPPF